MDRAPGELGDFGAFAKPVDRDEWDKVQMAELKHGRLAMLGVVGCLVQEVVTGEGPLEQISKGNVRLHACVCTCFVALLSFVFLFVCSGVTD